MLFRRRDILVRVLILASCIAAAGDLAAQPKTPVPDTNAQQTAKKAAGELFADRFTQVNRTSYPLEARSSRGRVGRRFVAGPTAYARPILRSC